ncbi:amino acid adenylation domain-containing protein [Actinokineospora sp.]|uniref:amino acid adenylation domain-containing protein n=1 Tax=Actinokineospora sp. TaxID=1872133 RepID=UPI003D6B60AD
MTTIFEQNQLLHAAPEHAEHWRRVVAATTDPTVVVRDFLGQDPARPTARHTAPLPDAALAEARRITKGDTTLLRLVHTAVAAVVTARATDTGSVTLVAPAPPDAAAAGLPVTARIDRDASFRTVLGAVRSAYLEAAAHAGVPFWLLFDRAGVSPSDIAVGVDGSFSAADAVAACCVLHFDIADGAVGLTYRTDLFLPTTAARLVHDYARVLGAVLSDVDSKLAPLIDACDDDDVLLAGFNDTGREFEADALLHGFLERGARAHPDRVAIRDDGTTYAALNAEANRWAHRLRALGVGRGDIVGVCLPRSPRELVAIYAVLKAGGAYLPVDATLPANRIEYMLEHSGALVVIGDASTRDAVASVEVFVDWDSPDGLPENDTDPDVVTDSRDLCYVIYTSGSTGRPKGVMIEHQAIVNRLLWMQRAYPLGEGDVILHKTPFTFDVSVWEIFWWSIAGAAVSTLPSGAERDPERIAARIAEHGVTTTHFVPSMLQAFLAFADAVGTGIALGTLRAVFASGEALGTSLAVRFHALLGHVELVNLYGPTEAAVDVSCQETRAVDPDRPMPIGRPIDNIVLRVLTTAGTVAPIGTPGELCIGGVGLARGYLNAPELTDQRFVADPVDPARRIYRTGDLARWTPAGVIEYLGRIDTQVKIRGYRIELGEIEHVAAKAPGVADCAVAALADERGDRALCAYVVAGPGFDAAEFTAELGRELPSYMVPTWVVEVEAIPTNHNGKRDVSGLPKPTRAADTDYVAPSSDSERVLVELWQSVLGVERVGVHDNFFALGGDSIKFIAVLAAGRSAGFVFTFQNLFANPSVAELAAVVRRGDAAGESAAAPPFSLLSEADRARLPADAVDAYPMSSLQTGLLYEAARSEQGSGLYHDILSYHITDVVDLDAFRSAVTTVAARHAIFRTAFHLDGFSEPAQVVRERVACPLTVFDLADLPAAEQDARLGEFAALELARGFRPGEPDLVRVHLHLLGDRGYQYTLSYHDAALDGWSVNTLHRDIFAAYFAALDGAEQAAADLTVSYRDFIKAEREAIADADQRQYWLDMLAKYESTRLPRFAGELPAGGVVLHDVDLPDTVAEGVVRTAAALRVPVKSVLLAAHVAALGFVAGTDTVLTGYEHSGRPEVVGGELLPGLFLNTIPFGITIGDGTWADLVREVYRRETDLLPYRRFPMLEMKRAVGTREPLFESVFNFTHFHVLKDLSAQDGFEMVRSVVNAQTEFPFRAEFAQDAISDQVQLSLHYHADAFTPEQITRVGGYYARALALLSSAPDEGLRARSLLSDDEATELTTAFRGATRERPEGTFVDSFAEHVAAAPDAVALVHGATDLTYRELDEASDRMANLLRANGVTAGSVVTTLLDRGVDWAATVLAVLKLSAVYLPQEPSYPAERLGSVLRRSGSAHLVVDASTTDAVRAALAAVMDTTPALLTPQDARALAAEPVDSRPAPGDPAYIIFTSGSTGEPKGATIRHSGMLNHLLAKVVDLDLTAADRIVQLATQCFDISVWQLLAAWVVGGRTVIVGQEVISDPAALLRTVADAEITILEFVPSYLDALLAEAEIRKVDLPALRYNLVTGEALPPGLTRRWFGVYDAPLVNAYGPTEASDDVTHHVVAAPVDGDRVPVGTAVLNTGLYVVDKDNRLRPLGTFGEIVVTGAGVGLGYVNDPERTAAAFHPNVLDDLSTMMYRTGDVGRWLPGGVLDCAGRVDHQVKVRGFRIELSEIEGTIGRLPGVDTAVVVVREAGGEKLLAAFYTGPAEYDVVAVREALAATLPSYMHPDSVQHLDAFPLTDNGKVDRAALVRLVAASAVRRVREEPADDQERLVAGVFAEVIGLAPEDVGATDNFFDIGGHSIAAMKVAIALGDAVTVRDLLTHPSPRALARHLRERAADRRELLVDLTAAAGLTLARAERTVVCVPFAGGSAVSYLDLARRLHQERVRVLGVELPARTGRDPRAAVPADRLGDDLAAEIATTVTTPVALLGHCAGTGPVLAAAAALRERGTEVERLFLVAKVLKSDDPDDHANNEVIHMTETEILDWLVDNTGFDELDHLSDTAKTDLSRAFRYDSAEASHAFATALRATAPARFPITAVYAADDPLVRGHEQAVATWGRFGDLDVRVAPDGGHYLNKTRPEFLAECVLAADGEATS